MKNFKHYSARFTPPENNDNGHLWMGDRIGTWEPPKGRYALMCSECLTWTEGFNWKCSSPSMFAYKDIFESDRYVCDVCAKRLEKPDIAKEGMTRKAMYAEYLKSPEWKAIRRRILARDRYRCALCPETKNLDVHHRSYENIFKEDDDDLIVLCRFCHERHHGRHDGR